MRKLKNGTGGAWAANITACGGMHGMADGQDFSPASLMSCDGHQKAKFVQPSPGSIGLTVSPGQ
jgi:hypothetical protein